MHSRASPVDGRDTLVEMMEVLLNAIWLLVAIVAFCYWHGVGYRGASTRRDPGTSYGILALACALILLFPVISLTDDLHSDTAVMEESSRTVMKARAATEACLRQGRSSFPAALMALASSAADFHVFAAEVVPLEPCALYLALISPCEGRSPPLPTA
jgi:uncharacterized membrane protein